MAEFLNGVIFKRKDNAPDFVIGQLSFKVDEFIKTLQEKEKNGWVNANIKRGQSGKPYIELDTWEAGGSQSKGSAQQSNRPSPATQEQDESDLPF
jgi:hypothetical protein